MGAHVKPVQFPSSTVPPFDSTVHAFDMIAIILCAESSATFDELARTNRDDVVERQDKSIWQNVFRTARFIPAVEYMNVNRYSAALGRKIQEFMQVYDVVIVPTFAGDQITITNLTGNPVVCMSICFKEETQPYSITLVGKLYDEASILEAAKAYQDNTDYFLPELNIS
jgi:Asp-tRNA(Asn)/Glu-tRNA(Gln) amidotransferase A subunit family amidase